MRLVIKKQHSTKAERRFYEYLKELHIPFKTKVLIGGREVDFLIGKYAVEIDAHLQDGSKNQMLLSKGYTPIHFNNKEIQTAYEWLKNIIWLADGKDQMLYKEIRAQRIVKE